MFIGITAEWNPLHRGHTRMIRKIRDAFPEAGIAAVMSGPFVQRGEPALFDKWTRAAWAVSAGVDAVFELPVISVLQSADRFAEDAVTILSRLGCTHIAFGVESMTHDELFDAARWILTDDAHRIFRENLRRVPYGEAVTKTVASRYPSLEEKLQQPNNMLGFRYTWTICANNWPMDIIPVVRRKEEKLSASLVRKDLLSSGETTLMSPDMAEKAASLMKEGCHTDYSRYADACLMASRLYREAELTDSGLFSEGLEHRWYAYMKSASYTDALASIKSKRYHMSRLRRIGASILLSAHDTPSPFIESIRPTYARLLALNEEKSSLLKSSNIPVVVSGARARRELTEDSQLSLLMDDRAQDVFAFCQASESFREGRKNYTVSPVILHGSEMANE